MKKVLFILLLNLYCFASAQSHQGYQIGETVYFNKWFRLVMNADSATQYVVIKDIQTINDQKLFLLELHKKNKASAKYNKVEMLFSKSARWIKREGKNTIFWENGQKKLEGSWKKGKQVGIWEEWYEDGTKMSDYEYFDESRVTNKKNKSSHIVNFWNRKGELIVKNGNGTYFFKNANGDEFLGKYVNHQKEGVWQCFRKDGSKFYSEEYVAGELKKGESWDKKGNRYEYTQIREKGGYIEGRKGIVNMISENFKVPKFALESGIEGTTVISFEVNKKGSIDTIEVAHRLCDPCSKEAIRVVKMLKNWKPGKLRGQNTRTRYNLPFRIRLTSK